LNPANTNYLYYVLKADGRSHFFTGSYDEFLRAKAKAGR
jgi:cell division protein YceG involved in septum cleavage